MFRQGDVLEMPVGVLVVIGIAGILGRGRAVHTVPRVSVLLPLDVISPGRSMHECVEFGCFFVPGARGPFRVIRVQFQ